ncbi:MAG: hypothetical protein RI967_1902 [Planctomycetota bacterium]
MNDATRRPHAGEAVGREAVARETVDREAVDREAGDRASHDTRRRRSELGRSAARGAAAMIGARVGGTALSLVATAILARFVAPADFGTVAMVTSILALARALEEIGFGEAMVQRERISDAQVSGLFWLNAASGLALTIAFLASAPLVGRFYGRPELVPIALALAPLFLLSALGGQHRAWMRRHFRFRTLALAQMAGVAGGAVAGCGAALAGLGLWALVAQQLAAATALLAASWIGSGFRPSRPARTEGMRPLVAFGSQLALSQMLVALTRNVDSILVGRFVGAAALGAYDRAFQLMSLPGTQLNQPLGAAVVPALSRLQDDPEGYRALYRRALGGAATSAFPVAVFLGVAAPAIVGVLLGPAWSESATLLRALAPTCLLVSLNVATGWVYQSLGRTGTQLAWTVFAAAVTILSMAAGLRYGALGVALSLSASRLALRLPAILICFRGTPLALRDIGAAVWAPATAAIAGGVVALLVDDASWPMVARLLAQAVAFTATTAVAALLLPGRGERLERLRTLFETVGARAPLRVADEARSRVEKPLQRRGTLRTNRLRLPDFLGVGAQKAGTTWLAENLRTHPGIFLPARKELHYFDESFHRSLASYARHFAPAGARVAGEITPAYAILDDERLDFIRRVMPGVRAIYLLRDPVERAWSGTVMELATLRNVDPHAIPTAHFVAHARSRQVLARSRHLDAIARWERTVRPGHLHLAFHEEIARDPAAMLAEVHRFLGVEPRGDAATVIRERVNAGPRLAMPDEVRDALVGELGDELRALADRFGGHAEEWRRRWLG